MWEILHCAFLKLSILISWLHTGVNENDMIQQVTLSVFLGSSKGWFIKRLLDSSLFKFNFYMNVQVWNYFINNIIIIYIYNCRCLYLLYKICFIQMLRWSWQSYLPVVANLALNNYFISVLLQCLQFIYIRKKSCIFIYLHGHMSTVNQLVEEPPYQISHASIGVWMSRDAGVWFLNPFV